MACGVRNWPGPLPCEPPFGQVAPVGRELDDARRRVGSGTGELAAVAVGDVDRAVVRHDDVARLVEGIAPGRPDARRAEREQQLARRAELHGDVPFSLALRIRAVGSLRVGDPHVALGVDVQPVRLDHEPGAEAGDQIAPPDRTSGSDRGRARRRSCRRSARRPRRVVRRGPCRHRRSSPIHGRPAASPSRGSWRKDSARRSAGRCPAAPPPGRPCRQASQEQAAARPGAPWRCGKSACRTVPRAAATKTAPDRFLRTQMPG